MKECRAGRVTAWIGKALQAWCGNESVGTVSNGTAGVVRHGRERIVMARTGAAGIGWLGGASSGGACRRKARQAWTGMDR